MKKQQVRNFFFIIFLNIFFYSSYNLIAQPFKLAGVSDLVRIFEDGFAEPATYDSIKLFGIRGEIISGQFIIEAKNNLANVSVEVSALNNITTGDILPKYCINWNFVGCIPLSGNARNQSPNTITRQAPADFPDYLMSERLLNITDGSFKAIWLTVTIPESLTSGEYSGQIRVKSDQGMQILPLSITIYPLTLPKEHHLAVTIWDNRSNFKQYHGIQHKYSPEWFEMIKSYAENMVAHRQNTFQVALNTIGFYQTENGEYTFDFTLFDKIAEVFWNTGKMDILELGLSDNRGELTKFGENGWSGNEIIIMDVELRNSQTGEQVSLPGKQIIPKLLPALENHLSEYSGI